MKKNQETFICLVTAVERHVAWLQGFLILLVLAGSARAACAPSDQKPVADTVTALLAAAEKDDSATMDRIMTPSFYAYDNGKRFDRAGMETVIRDLHAKGTVLQWSVTQPDVHISCDTAWIAYVNQGSITQNGKQMPLTWLESADLTYAGGAWHVDFLQSERQAHH